MAANESRNIAEGDDPEPLISPDAWMLTGCAYAISGSPGSLEYPVPQHLLNRPVRLVETAQRRDSYSIASAGSRVVATHSCLLVDHVEAATSALCGSSALRNSESSTADQIRLRISFSDDDNDRSR